MFRLTRYLQALHDPDTQGREGQRPQVAPPTGPVVIWNLVRRCNLTCKHCYSISADIDFPGELSTAEVFEVMDDLRTFGVPVLILSGGEPLLRGDIFDISQHAKAMGFYVGLSTNGTLIDDDLETDDPAVADGVMAEVGRMLPGLSRREVIEAALAEHGLVVVAPGRAAALRARLLDRRSIRELVVMRELLDPPVALREPCRARHVR